MEIEHLTIFAETAREGSFAAVARMRGIDPSQVSRSIAGLEDELGFRLFERSTRKISLTEAGAQYLARLQPLLSDLDGAAQAARDMVATPRGTLRVTASTAFGERVLLPMLPAFRDAYPDVNVHLMMDDRQVDLIENRLDLAVRLVPSAPPEMIISRLMPCHFHVVASPEYLAKHPISAPEDLAELDCLRYPLPGFRDRWHFRKSGTTGPVQEVPISGSFILTTANVMRRSAIMGMGPALIANWIISDDFEQGRLVDVFPDLDASGGNFDSAAYLIYPSRSYLPAKTRVFIDMLRAHVVTCCAPT